MIREPRVLLLDEATSALDADNEYAVQQAIDALIAKKNLTVIMIAHRLSTVRDVDKIIVINKGEVVEEGTHNDLVMANGAYKKLVERQLQKKDKEEIK